MKITMKDSQGNSQYVMSVAQKKVGSNNSETNNSGDKRWKQTKDLAVVAEKAI